MTRSIEDVLKQYWGYDSFRPLQKEAMECVVNGRDSIVVLPTGGGKSLCFQAPAVTMPGMAIVVSPLISLMKDQVDALTECGVSAARLDSALKASERESVFTRINQQKLKLLYLSPERLFSNDFINYLKNLDLSFVAVDEAHCVSMWGHDFRPEYRQLGQLKKSLPGIAIHAYTATATEHVRNDIAKQLCLVNPETLVGSFDRPNLLYKTERRSNVVKQVCGILDRHPNESGIIYCIRRVDVDNLCEDLSGRGHSVLPYHAGMNDELRKNNQEAFIKEKTDIIIATVAFGMGIDKSNVRYVIHTGMPKSLEHYQQESGRAGRDGLEAECCLIYSGGDFGIWQHLLRDMEPEAMKIARSKLNDIFDYCTGITCRHKALVNYFGQDLDKENCTACDVCLGDLDLLDDSLETAQKIVSCVKRLDERFGAGYTAQVLTGSGDKRILENAHDELTTYGLLSEFPLRTVRDWIEQLTAQGYLQKTGDYNVLTITQAGWGVVRGEVVPRLLKPAKKAVKESKAAKESWQGVDRDLFDSLRALRREIADERNVPAYVVFSDAALRGMARNRPSTPTLLLQVSGVGETKKKQYGKTFLKAIREYCESHSLEMDIGISVSSTEKAKTGRARAYEPWTEKEEQQIIALLSEGKKINEIAKILDRKSSAIRSRINKLDLNPQALRSNDFSQSESTIKPGEAKLIAFELFARDASLEETAGEVDRKLLTVLNYLIEYIEKEKIDDPQPWVDREAFQRITKTAHQQDSPRLKPIYDALNGEISYESIRIAMACLRNGSE